MARVKNGAADDAARDFRPGTQVEFIAVRPRRPSAQVVVNKDRVGKNALASQIIDRVTISRKGAVPHDGAGMLENGNDARIGEGLLARALRDHINAGVGNIVNEEAIDNPRGAAFQEVNRGPGDLGPVSQKHRVFDQDRFLVEALVLDGDARTARTGVIVHDLDIANRGIGTAENFDGAAVGVKEEVFGDRRVGLDPLGKFVRHEMVCAAQAESLQDGVRGDAVAEIDDMIDDGREAGSLRAGDFRIGCAQGDGPGRLEADAVVQPVEPDKGLALARGAVFPGMDLDDFVGFVFSRQLQGILDTVSGKDVVAILLENDFSARRRGEKQAEPDRPKKFKSIRHGSPAALIGESVPTSLRFTIENSWLIAKVIFQNQDRRPFLLPTFIKSPFHFVRSAVGRPEDDVEVAVAIDVANVHHQPAAQLRFGERPGDEIQPALVFQVNETLLGRVIIVWKVSNRGDVQVAIAVEVRGPGLVRSIERIKEGELKTILAAVQVKADSVIVPQAGRILAVVAIGGEHIHAAIPVEVHELESCVAPNGRLLNDRQFAELSSSVIQQQVNAFARLRHEHDDVQAPVVVEIVKLGPHGARPVEENVLGVFARAQIFIPAQLPHPIAKARHHNVLAPVPVQVTEGAVRRARQGGNHVRPLGEGVG